MFEYVKNILKIERNNLSNSVLYTQKNEMLGISDIDDNDYSAVQISNSDLKKIWSDKIKELNFAIALLNGDNNAVKEFFNKIDN